jgi:hypothetical protein
LEQFSKSLQRRFFPFFSSFFRPNGHFFGEAFPDFPGTTAFLCPSAFFHPNLFSSQPLKAFKVI